MRIIIAFSLIVFFIGSISAIEGRGADEPCSYLHPEWFVKDPKTGECIYIKENSDIKNQNYDSEPCSYLHPDRYVRDPKTGNCVEIKKPEVKIEPSTPVSAPKKPTLTDAQKFELFLQRIPAFIGVLIPLIAICVIYIKYRAGPYGSPNNPATGKQARYLRALGHSGPIQGSSRAASDLIQLILDIRIIIVLTVLTIIVFVLLLAPLL